MFDAIGIFFFKGDLAQGVIAIF